MAGESSRFASMKRCMIALGGWFGGPVVEWSGREIDGRARLRCWGELAYPSSPPRLVCTTMRQAARALFYAGHYRRILEVFPELDLGTKDGAAGVLMVHHSEVGPLLDALRGVPRQRTAVKRVRRQGPRRAVKRVAALVGRALEDGRQTVPVAELRALVEPWLV